VRRNGARTLEVTLCAWPVRHLMETRVKLCRELIGDLIGDDSQAISHRKKDGDFGDNTSINRSSAGNRPELEKPRSA
jgi:hypothetical protein